MLECGGDRGVVCFELRWKRFKGAEGDDVHSGRHETKGLTFEFTCSRKPPKVAVASRCNEGLGVRFLEGERAEQCPFLLQRLVGYGCERTFKLLTRRLGYLYSMPWI